MCAATSSSGSATLPGARGGRDQVPEEGHQVDRGAAPVLRQGGNVDNCQLGVVLAYAGPRGGRWWTGSCTCPREWAIDVDRRTEAHVPEEVGFQTKPRLAQAMLERALDVGVPAGG